MRTLVVALGLAAVLAVAIPRPAAADFSLSIGLPGFGLFISDPYPRPLYPPVVAYAPPVVAYPAPVYAYGYRRPTYRSYGRSYGYGYGRGYDRYRGRGRGHYKHGHKHHGCDD